MFPFIKLRPVWYSISAALLLVSAAALYFWGLQPGLDFAGGTLLEVHFSGEQPVDEDSIREVLIPIGDEYTAAQVDNPDATPISFNNAIIQPSEGNYIIRSLFMDQEVHDQVISSFQTRFGSVEELRYQTIGSVISQDLKEKAFWAVGLAIVFIIFFIAYAFRKVPASISPWKFGFAAVAALVHDILITCGVFAILGHFLGVEVDLLFITALLTIMGFSVHDTIVVFDRLRENLARSKGNLTFAEAANLSLNQTLARSINTSLTTLITLSFLLIFGSESIRWFVAAMIVGMIAGTYSSIFFATPLLVSWSGKGKK